MSVFSQHHRKSILIFLSTYIFSFLISGEHVIAISTSSVATLLAFFAGKHLEDKRSWQLLEVVPEIWVIAQSIAR